MAAAGNKPAPATAPDYSLRVVHTSDPDQLAENLSQWDQIYDQLKPGPFEGRSVDAWFGDMQLFRETSNRAVHEGGAAWPGSRTFGIPLVMEGKACYGGREMGRDMMLTLGGAMEFEFWTPQVLDIIGLTLDTQFLREFARPLEGGDYEVLLAGRALISGAVSARRAPQRRETRTEDLRAQPRLDSGHRHAMGFLAPVALRRRLSANVRRAAVGDRARRRR